MPDKRPPEHFLVLKYNDGTSARFTLADVVHALGKKMPNEVRLGMVRSGVEMHAAFQPREADYPGIMIDASTAQAGNVYLGNFELPCETYPTRIAARLYAGCEKFETDEPIAIVTHEVTDDARVIYRSQNHPHPEKSMRKIVYVDEQLAKSAPWTDAGEENMPEHVEDAHPEKGGYPSR